MTMIASCDLNLVPSTSIVYEEGKPLFLSKRDIAEFQNGVIATYRGLHYGSSWQTVEVMTECFNASIDFGNNYGFVHRLGSGFLASDDYTTGIWAGHYGAIKNYNIAIEQCEMVEDEALKADANVLKGIALFCRASSYIQLARHFGYVYNPATAATDPCVPLVTVYDQLKKAERATVKQVYDQIIADLNAAEPLLASAPGAVRSQLPTVDAVKALKARYYLDVKDYANAAKMAEEVIATGKYVLASNAEEMAAEYTNDEGNEPIMQLYASQSEGTVGNTIYTAVGNEDAGKYFAPYYLPSQYLVSAYDATDIRFTNWFTNSLYPVKMSGVRHAGVTVFVKYLDNPALHTGTIETGAHAAKPLLISEMYLIAAEANALNNNAEAAKTALNALQTARSANNTEATIENIKKEWMKETVGEGLYFTCVKRWGEGFPERPGHSVAAEKGLLMTGVGYQDRTIEANNRVFNWPIPTYEMQLNKELQQNPGYGAE